MENSDFVMWELAKEKAERYQKEAADYRLAAGFPKSESDGAVRPAVVLLALSMLGALLWLFAS